jgi:hypothetical protein
MSRRSLLSIAIAIAALLVPLAPISAGAATPGAAFSITADAVPTVFSPEHDGSETPDNYTLTVANTGSVATDGSPITISDALPSGVTAVRVVGAEIQQDMDEQEEEEGSARTIPCNVETVTCTYGGQLVPGDTLRINVRVVVAAGVTGSVTNSASVSGGGVQSSTTVVPTRVGSDAESLGEPFGFSRFDIQVTGMDGLSDTQAGDHPYEITTSYAMTTAYNREPVGEAPINEPPYMTGGTAGYGGSVKDTVVDLPPGFVGNPDVVSKCPEDKVNQVLSAVEKLATCPPNTQIGLATIYTSASALSGEGGSTTGGGSGLSHIQTVPIFNIMPDKGYPAQFAFQFAKRTITLYVNVNHETNYGVRVTTATSRRRQMSWGSR